MNIKTKQIIWRIKSSISNYKLRLVIEHRIRMGYILENKEPVRCYKCSSVRLEECNEVYPITHTPPNYWENYAMKYDVKCKDCSQIVGHWAYGFWTIHTN